jgi:hypothetical protein
VTREPAGRRDRLRAYTILVDAQAAGRVRAGQSIDIPTAPGDHVVQIAIDWARSPRVEVSVEQGQVVRLRCAPNTAQPVLIGATVGRGEWVRLWKGETGDAISGPTELPVPWLRLLTLALLLAALAISIAAGRAGDAAAVGLLAIVPASLTVAWLYARSRR